MSTIDRTRHDRTRQVFDSLDAATTQAEFGLAEMAASKSAVQQLTNWPWINAILKD